MEKHSPNNSKESVPAFDNLKLIRRQECSKGLGFVASKMPWTCSDLSGLHTERTYQLLEKASIIYYNFDDRKHQSYLPIGQIAISKIESIMRDTMAKRDIQELYLPQIQPIELWKTSGRIDDFKHKVIYVNCHSRPGESHIISPTNEEVATLMAKKLIKSYKQMPLNFFQIGDKFRDVKSKHGLINSDIFRVFEAYSINRDEGSLDVSAKLFESAFTEAFKRMGIKTFLLRDRKGYLEFMSETKDGDEQIAVCACGKQYNYPEIGETCSMCGEHFSTVTAVNMGCVMKEGTRYSEKFNARFQTENGELNLFDMGTYGLGISRALHAIVDQNRDKFGIVWPKSVRPIDFCIMPVDSQDPMQMSYAKELCNLARNNGKTVILEDRDKKLGWKIRAQDLIGTGAQIIIGNNEIEKNEVSVKRRQANTYETVSLSNIGKFISNN